MKAKTESDTALSAVIGIDIGKDVFHLVGLGGDGKIAAIMLVDVRISDGPRVIVER